jgi:hypothetical protein
LAKQILHLAKQTPATLSSCNLTLDELKTLRRIVNDLSQLDETAENSLKLRSEGLNVVSMQPHVHPLMPLAIDWAYVPYPSESVEIDLPELDHDSLTGLEG